MWTWLYDEKRVISASRTPRIRVIQPWMSNSKTLSTTSPHRSAHNTPVLPNRVRGKGRVEAPSQPPTHSAGAKTWAACSREHSSQQSPHDLQPEQLLSRFPEAAGLHPTNRPFAGSNLGSQPGAGAPSSPPKGKAQAIPKQLAAFSGAGGRPIGRANAIGGGDAA